MYQKGKAKPTESEITIIVSAVICFFIIMVVIYKKCNYRGAIKQLIQTMIMMTTTINSQKEPLNNMTIVSHPMNLMQYHELWCLSSHQLTKWIKSCTEETYATIYGTGPTNTSSKLYVLCYIDFCEISLCYCVQYFIIIFFFFFIFCIFKQFL